MQPYIICPRKHAIIFKPADINPLARNTLRVTVILLKCNGGYTCSRVHDFHISINLSFNGCSRHEHLVFQFPDQVSES